MRTEITIEARRFPVTIKDGRTGEVSRDHIILDKDRLRACQLVGQSSNELIYRIYNAQGYRVLDIGTAERRSLPVNLDELWRSGAVRA